MHNINISCETFLSDKLHTTGEKRHNM